MVNGVKLLLSENNLNDFQSWDDEPIDKDALIDFLSVDAAQLIGSFISRLTLRFLAMMLPRH